MKEMYKGMVNSPQTKLSKAINSADTDIYVKDGSVFPTGPNLAVIGIDQHAETILYSSVSNNILVGCTRGYQGEARAWDAEIPIARNFTEADLDAVQENIKALNKNKVSKENGKQLSTNDYTNEAKAKVDAIPADPKYTDTVQDLSDYLKKSDVFDNKTFNGELIKLKNIPLSARQGVNLWGRLEQVAPDGVLDPSRMITKISIQDREPYPNNELRGLLLSGALDELFLRTTKLNERKANRTELKTKLSEMTDDSTHRLVTDAEKTEWNNKLDSVRGKDVSRSKTKGYNTSNTWSSLSTNRDLEDWIGDFDKRTRENKEAISNVAKIVVLTESEYKALSNKDQNTIYFVR